MEKMAMSFIKSGVCTNLFRGSVPPCEHIFTREGGLLQPLIHLVMRLTQPFRQRSLGFGVWRIGLEEALEVLRAD